MSSHSYQASFYRISQYDSAESAHKNKGLYRTETTYGYDATMDCVTNMRTILECYAYNAINEFRFIWTIDGVKFPEMTYGQTVDLLDASVFPESKKFQNFLVTELQPA